MEGIPSVFACIDILLVRGEFTALSVLETSFRRHRLLADFSKFHLCAAYLLFSYHQLRFPCSFLTNSLASSTSLLTSSSSCLPTHAQEPQSQAYHPAQTSLVTRTVTGKRLVLRMDFQLLLLSSMISSKGSRLVSFVGAVMKTKLVLTVVKERLPAKEVALETNVLS